MRISLKAFLVVLAVGIVANMNILADSLSDLPTKTINGRSYYYYEIKPKETEYSLCRRFGITRDDILKYNPSQADGLKAYATLYFPVDVFGENAIQVVPETPVVEPPVVAEVTDEPMTDEEASTPAVDIETPAEEEPYIAEIATSNEEIESYDSPDNSYADVPIDNNYSVEASDSNLIITLMLPLETNAKSPSKLAQHLGEFYQGFLIGVKEYSGYGMPLTINLIDTSVSDEDFEKILESETVASTDVFIGPETEGRLRALAAKANLTEAPVINAFVVNDDLYQTNPTVVQTNIPRDNMYAGAIEKFLVLYPNATPVFLARVDGEADKVAFTDQLKERLKAEDRRYKDVVYRGVLTLEDMSALDPAEDYVFIPVSSSLSEFGKFSGGVRDFRDAALAANGSVRLFGYPEWTTFRNEQLEQLKEFNATIYSRFYNADNFDTNMFRHNFKQWYGSEISDIEPNQALLGYDLARYVVPNLRAGNGDFFPSALKFNRGLQSSFAITNVFDGGGYVNGALYFITFNEYAAPFIEVVEIPVKVQLGK